VFTAKNCKNLLSDQLGSDPLNIQRHPSAPEAATTTNIRHAAAGSCSFPTVQKSCRRMLQRRNRKRRPKIHDS